jgi:hypothetical protein
VTKGELATINMLLCRVNKVTAPHRHGQPISKAALDNLSNEQIDIEEWLKTVAQESEESAKLAGVDLVVNQQCVVREKDSITPEEYGFCPHCIARFSFRKLDKTFICPWCHKDVRTSTRMA